MIPKPLLALGFKRDDVSEEEILARIAELTAAEDIVNALPKRDQAREAAIKLKVKAGLSREQAIEVLDRQAEHDATVAEAKAAARKSAPKK